MSKVTVDQLLAEEQFIIDNFATMAVLDMARKFDTKEVNVSRRISAMKKEGKLPDEKPKIMSKYREWEHKPMKKVMDPAPPKGSLSKKNIQEDILQVGKEYIISRKVKKGKIKKAKLRVIGAYDNYYLLEDERGRKDSLLKVDYYIGEWWVS